MKTMSRTVTWFLLVVIAMSLAACGGQPATPAATNTPTGPAIEPAATDLPTATAAPTATLAPTPTPKPPTPTPAPVARSKCNNPYYPVAPGLTWVYAAAEPASTTYTTTLDNITDSSFTMVQTFDNLTNESNYLCTPEGLTTAQFSGLQMEEANIQIETRNGRGVMIPAGDAWQVGETWDASFDLIGSMTASEGISGTITGTVTMTNEIVAREKVTVPAGTFDAFRVDSVMTETMYLNMGGVAMPDPISIAINMSSWYAEGVGVIKSSSGLSEDTLTTTELVSFKK